MSVILLVLGILLTGAGVITLGYGISISETNLGNALIIAGTTTFSAGLLLIGLAAAVVQLNQIARALRPRAGAKPPRPGELAEPTMPPVAAVRHPPVLAVPPTPPAPPMRSPVPPKPKIEERIPTAVAAEPAPVSASAIERLRSSLGRGAQKATSAPEGEALPLAPEPAPQTHPGANKLTNGATPPSSQAGEPAEAPRKARLDFLFRSKPRETPSDTFDAVWPKRGAPRADEHANESVEPVRPPARPWPPEPSDSAAEEATQPPAILKSGVVDGMAYTLYADGSIEAQLPQGTVRFGSIAELRAHIENNS
jgi:hypothetical protein